MCTGTHLYVCVPQEIGKVNRWVERQFREVGAKLDLVLPYAGEFRPYHCSLIISHTTPSEVAKANLGARTPSRGVGVSTPNMLWNFAKKKTKHIDVATAVFFYPKSLE